MITGANGRSYCCPHLCGAPASPIHDQNVATARAAFRLRMTSTAGGGMFTPGTLRLMMIHDNAPLTAAERAAIFPDGASCACPGSSEA